MTSKKKVLPKLPQLLARKIYKTGQTRGADDAEIYQNRVNRTNTPLIPFSVWSLNETIRETFTNYFTEGFIVLIPPHVYFPMEDRNNQLKQLQLVLGENALLFYELRSDWITYNPDVIGLNIATSRKNPLNGEYVARIPALTSSNDGEKIFRGFTTTSSKGLGIRAYEYASKEIIDKCRLQLEAVFWMCHDSIEIASIYGMALSDAEIRKKYCIEKCHNEGLLQFDLLIEKRIINTRLVTICPLCLDEISAEGFFSKVAQAQGREVSDLTITSLNLFHIVDVKYGEFNHTPYNLGWGHHHCNVVVKDDSIEDCLNWMEKVINTNKLLGYYNS